MILNSELVQANRKVKYEGKSHNNIEIIKYLGSHPIRKAAYYLCKCKICSSEFVGCNTSFVDKKYKDGCLHCSRNKNAERRKLHGMRKSKVYNTWRKIKERCFNPNDISYKNYGANGISLAKEYEGSFLEFYKEVGDCPQDSNNYTIDRVDCTKGYVKGNMRWATKAQQARNKKKYSVNTSGFNGVAWYNSSITNSEGSKLYYLYAVAQWYEDGKLFNKKFSVNKHGLLPAFSKACEFRENKIKELNLKGYGYSEKHGK